MKQNRFILISNYIPDRQDSMLKYASSLSSYLIRENIEVEIWHPLVFFGVFFKTTVTGPGKWLGYIDKWIVFPLILRLRILLNAKYAMSNYFFHVCDHSNSPYLGCLPADRSGVTCHDVLAIRGALGYEDAYCPASRAGRLLQAWILSHLRRAKILTAVSELTMRQLLELCEDNHEGGKSKWKVIHNSFNAHFYPMEKVDSDSLISDLGLLKPYILHVGSSLPRKNRNMLLYMVKELGVRWNGYICFVGEPLDENLISEAEELGLSSRVISIVKPDHRTLIALYSRCDAFVFPSYSEGFGWPLIEAQACGAPVLASNVAPLPEVSGGTAKHVSPNDPVGFAREFLALIDDRDKYIMAGFENIKRFDTQLLTREFVKLYVN